MDSSYSCELKKQIVAFNHSCTDQSQKHQMKNKNSILQNGMKQNN